MMGGNLNTYQLLVFPDISRYSVTSSLLLGGPTIWHLLRLGKGVKAKAEKSVWEPRA
jgi:hypothetical protein